MVLDAREGLNSCFYSSFAGVVYGACVVANCSYYGSVNAGMAILANNQDNIDLSVFTDGGNVPLDSTLRNRLYSPAFSFMYYNRLESVLETICVSIDNLTSTRSTIQDADIAEKSSEYILNQILRQASVVLLATANQTPSIAISINCFEITVFYGLKSM